jgi:hypothetical protein
MAGKSPGALLKMGSNLSVGVEQHIFLANYGFQLMKSKYLISLRK